MNRRKGGRRRGRAPRPAGRARIEEGGNHGRTEHKNTRAGTNRGGKLDRPEHRGVEEKSERALDRGWGKLERGGWASMWQHGARGSGGGEDT